MSDDKEKNSEAEKIIREEHLRESFNKEITSNTSETTNDIPQFTTGDGDTAGGESSSDTNSSE